MSNYIYTCACCGTCWDCTSTGRKPAKAELAGMVCQPCRMAPKRIAELEAELAKTKAQAEGEAWNLSQQNAALREDKARLDAVDAQCPEGFDWSITRLDSGGWKIHPLRKEYLGFHSRAYRHFATARAAIDAARKGAR